MSHVSCETTWNELPDSVITQWRTSSFKLSREEDKYADGYSNAFILVIMSYYYNADSALNYLTGNLRLIHPYLKMLDHEK